MTRSFPQPDGPAPEGATFHEVGPARTLKTALDGRARIWTGRQAPPGPNPHAPSSPAPPFRARFLVFCDFAGRSLHRLLEEVAAVGADASAFLWPSPKRGMGGASG